MSTQDWIAIAQEIGRPLAEHAARHDHERTFVEEGYAALKERGLFGALVPPELGGKGAGVRDICELIRTLAHSCSSTALAYSMHSHLVATTVWRHRHGAPAEALLRRVAEQNLVLVSTGAGDWLESNGVMEKVDGGYRYTSRKPFSSGVPRGDVLMTSGRYDDPSEGPLVLHFPLAVTAPGVTVGDDWDTHGMRGTGSHTVHIDGAFIPEASIAMRRPRGPWHPAFNAISTLALPILMSAYLGVAERAVELALAEGRKRRDDPNVQYLSGELVNELFGARAIWSTMVENAAEYDFAPELERASRALQGKTLLAAACDRTASKAMELGGGGAYFRANELERLMRDVRAAIYHPMQPKRQHVFSGRLALGLDPVLG